MPSNDWNNIGGGWKKTYEQIDMQAQPQPLNVVESDDEGFDHDSVQIMNGSMVDSVEARSKPEQYLTDLVDEYTRMNKKTFFPLHAQDGDFIQCTGMNRYQGWVTVKNMNSRKKISNLQRQKTMSKN